MVVVVVVVVRKGGQIRVGEAITIKAEDDVI